MLPSAHYDIAVRVINTTAEPRLIKRDTYVGVLTPISVINETDNSADIPTSGQSVEPASQCLINALPSELSDQ